MDYKIVLEDYKMILESLENEKISIMDTLHDLYGELGYRATEVYFGYKIGENDVQINKIVKKISVLREKEDKLIVLIKKITVKILINLVKKHK